MFDQGVEFYEVFQYKVDYKDANTDADPLSVYVTPSGTCQLKIQLIAIFVQE